MTKYDSWWTSLPVAQKERIASKVVSENAGEELTCDYPNCTNVWFDLSDYKKKKIYDHCVDDHGLLKPDWQEGNMMSE